MISNQGTFIQTPSTGMNTVFAYPNQIQNVTALQITAIDTSGNPFPFTYQSGTTFFQATLSITATVSGIGADTGCSIKLSAPLSLNWLMDLRSDTPELQATSYKNQGQYLPDMVENSFDSLTRQVQDLTRLSYIFGIHGPDLEVVPWTSLPGPAGRANLFLAFDGNGMPIAAPGGGGGGGGGGSPGAPGVNAIVVTVSAPALQVPCDSSGNVTSFALAFGQANLYSGVTNLTPLATWSIVQQVNCTAAITATTGVYTFSALSQSVGTITIQALYQGQTYPIQVTISKIIPGAQGNPGAPGTPGAPATPGLSLVLSNAAATVLAFANGGVPSFAGISGQAFLLSGGTDISATAVWSVVAANCTGTINTAANTPVSGQPVGYYQVTAMTAPIGTLTISATASGSTLTAVYTVTQVPTGYQIVNVLPTVPGPQSFEGNVVFLTTDGQLYRFHAGAWTPSVPATNITGTLTSAQIASVTAAQLTGLITSTQIGPNAISTAQLQAGAVTTAQIAAGTIVAGNIAASTITGTQIAASSILSSNIAASAIVANNIAAGAVTAAKIGVSSLSAISANIGAITAGTLANSGGSALIDLNNSWIVFNNGTFMIVRGLGFGAASNYLEWYGPTQSSASNFAACTDALGVWWLKTNGTSFFGGSVAVGGTVHSYTAPASGSVEVVPKTGTCTIEIYGGGGGASARNSATNCGGGGGAAYSKLVIAVTAGQHFTFTVGALGAGGIYVSGPGISGNNGTASSVSGVVSGGTVAMSAGGGLAGAIGAGGTGGTATGGSTNSSGSNGGLGQPGTGGSAGGPLGGATSSLDAGQGNFVGGGGASDTLGGQGGSGAMALVQFTYV